jgi:hypothetical protein
MPDPAKAELLRALGRLLRGLSIVFWALAITALIYLEMARAQNMETVSLDAFSRLAFIPSMLVSVMLWLGLHQMHAFQPQERIWRRALDRAQALAVADAGLAPFLFWWHRFPAVPLFQAAAGVLFLSSLFLLVQMNNVLRRLCAMLPDETLRSETKLFTTFNISFILTLLAAAGFYFFLSRFANLPWFVWDWLQMVGGGMWIVLFLVLLPLAMTMALVWKIREVIFTGLLTANG